MPASEFVFGDVEMEALVSGVQHRHGPPGAPLPVVFAPGVPGAPPSVPTPELAVVTHVPEPAHVLVPEPVLQAVAGARNRLSCRGGGCHL